MNYIIFFTFLIGEISVCFDLKRIALIFNLFSYNFLTQIALFFV